MFGNISGNKSNICKRVWLKFDRETFILGYFFVDRVNLWKIVELNAEKSSKVCLDKISMLLDTSAPLKRINVYKLKFKSKSLITSDNLRLTKINICEKEIIYKFH